MLLAHIQSHGVREQREMEMDDFLLSVIGANEINQFMAELNNNPPYSNQGEPPNEQMVNYPKNENVYEAAGFPQNSYDLSFGPPDDSRILGYQSSWPEFNLEDFVPGSNVEVKVQPAPAGPEGTMIFHGIDEENNGNIGIPSMYEEILQMERDGNYASLMPQPQPTSTTTSTGRAKKRTVPKENKDEKYWEKRHKNTEATKRCREMKKIKIKEIISAKKSKEDELVDLRDRFKNLKKKCTVMEESNQSLEVRLSKIAKLLEMDDNSSSELENTEE